jgi:hypothetical protein
MNIALFGAMVRRECSCWNGRCRPAIRSPPYPRREEDDVAGRRLEVLQGTPAIPRRLIRTAPDLRVVYVTGQLFCFHAAE